MKKEKKMSLCLLYIANMMRKNKFVDALFPYSTAKKNHFPLCQLIMQPRCLKACIIYISMLKISGDYAFEASMLTPVG